MAKLPRVTNRRFGSDIEIDNIGQFGSAAAGEKTNTKDVAEIQALEAWKRGWTRATMSSNKYPTMQERNGVDYVHAYQIDYLLKEGVPEYDSQTEYSKGAIVKKRGDNNVVLYESLLDDNIGQDLDSSTAWQKFVVDKNVLRTTQITNCITEIPQRIKLELADGVLILKAGSVVIIPNGFEADGTTRKFDYHTLNNDVTLLASNVQNTQYYVYNAVTGGFDYLHVTYSGTEHHTSNSGISYNTKTNNVKIYSGANTVYSDKVSFPFVKVTSNGTVITVNEVFNGFGYIGSTVWVDKGVKGLIPDGRNEDGTFKNIEWENNQILIGNISLYSDGNKLVLIGGKTIAHSCYKGEYLTAPALGGSNGTYFNTTENRFYRNDSRKWASEQVLILGDLYNIGLSSLKPKQTFKAVDYNELTPTIPDYSAMVQADGTGWIQVAQDSFVMSYGVDAYAEDYWVQVSPNQSTVYNVGRRADNTNTQTQHVSFTFFVPAKWYFRTTAEEAHAYIYPLKGAK